MELQVIQSMIYEIRGQRVMLDRDLAGIYQVETRVLNQAVKRNIKRFPSDFMFQLTEDEFQNLKSQFVTSSWGGVRKLPNAFTEQGVAMLSGLLNSDVAIEANIRIMRAFVFVRNMLVNPSMNEISKLKQEVKKIKEYIEEVFADYNDINEDTRVQLELINQSLAELQVHKEILTKPHRPIGYIQQK